MDLNKCNSCKRRTNKEFNGKFRCMAKKEKDAEGNVTYMDCDKVTGVLCHYEYLPPLPVDLEKFSKKVSSGEEMTVMVSYLRRVYAEGYDTDFFKNKSIEEVFEALTKGKSTNRQRMIRHYVRVYREFLLGRYEP